MVCTTSIFLNVAHGTQALYAEMREGLLSDASEYASKPLTDHLKRRPTRWVSTLAERVFAQVRPSRLTRCSFRSWRILPRLRDCAPRFPCSNAPNSFSVYLDLSRNLSKRSVGLFPGVIVVTEFFFLSFHRASMKLRYARITRANFFEILGRGKCYQSSLRPTESRMVPRPNRNGYWTKCGPMSRRS